MDLISDCRHVTCTLAPDAYQKGPEIPYLYATEEDCKRVAAHVHEETTAEATSPVLTFRPAAMYSSEVTFSPKKRFWIIVITVMMPANTRPKPSTGGAKKELAGQC